MNEIKIKATIYRSGMFGITATEVTSLGISVGKWAQYASAVHVRYVPKGKRSPRGEMISHDPYLVILEGHGHVKPDGMYDPAKSEAGGQVSRYASCDPRWRSDFDAKLSAYLSTSGAKVLHDFRGFDTSKAQPAAAVSP
jgi:hypothetical protein